MILIIYLSILLYSATAVQKFYTESTTNTFGDFSLGAGYDINRFEPKSNHVFRESKIDLLYDIMPITSTKSRCSLVANQKDVRDKLFVYGSVSVKYKMITGSGSITYDSKKESMNKVAYYKCTIDRTLFTISLNVPEITKDWDPEEYIPSDLLALESEEEIIDEIGDYHIRSITYGRRYNTEIRIEYTSEDAYELLKGKLKAEIGMGVLKVSAEVQLELESESFEEDLTMSVGSEALGFIEAQPLYLPSQTLSKKLEDGTVEQVSINDQIDEMIEKNLKAFNEIDAQGDIEPKTGLSKSELFQEIGDAYPLWYAVDKNLRYFKDKLTKLSAFEEEQMLENLDQAYDIMRELKDMTENIELRAEELFNSYHLLSGATDLSLEFLKYRQGLMNTILAYRLEVVDYIQQPAKKLAAKDIYLWAASDQETDRHLTHISMDVLATKIWDLLGMEDVEMEDDNEIGAACLFNGVQATLEGDNRRRKFAGRVVFGSLTVRHVLFDVDGRVVSLGYIDHEHANRDDPTWMGIAHELVFVREDCTLLKTGSDVWYHGARYKISAIGSEEHLTPRGYVNKDKLTNVRMHLQPQDTTRQIEVVITDAEVRDVELRGTETSGGFTVDAEDRLMYRNGYVCDKDFQKYEANMICTNLGYADVLYYQTGFEIPASNAWGRPRITMVDLSCPALAYRLEECTYTNGDDMDDKLWGSCKTQNGVQLKCVNEYIPSEDNANMEVISETVSCVRNEESMNKRIDTAESCSGADGDADTFGHVQKVVVKGDICVKLYRNQRLECVISEKSSEWDFTLPDTLGRFCYDTYGESEAEFPFPDQIEMMSTHRPERCVDQVDLLETQELSYMKDGNVVPIIECGNPKADGLCDSNDHLSAEEQRLFDVACFKTCTECSVNTRQHYQIKVVPNEASFALNDNVKIPVQVTLKGGASESDKSNLFLDVEEYVFDGDYECGSRIQLIATVQQPYDHGDVVCSMSMISTDGRIDTDGNVIVSGDVEVTFQCINPPTHAPSMFPSVAPAESESPSEYPTIQPTIEPTGCASKYTHYPGIRGNFQLLTGDELIPTDPVCVTNDDWTPPFCRDGKYPQGLAIGADRCKVACDARPNCKAIGIMYPNRGTSAECLLYGEPNNNNPLSSYNDFDWYNKETECETDICYTVSTSNWDCPSRHSIDGTYTPVGEVNDKKAWQKSDGTYLRWASRWTQWIFDDDTEDITSVAWMPASASSTNPSTGTFSNYRYGGTCGNNGVYVTSVTITESICGTDGEHYASWGSANSAATILASNDNTYGVRCVSDSDRSGDGWSKRMGCSVWTESDTWAEGCVTKTWSEANTFCHQQSGRLPTLFEIEQNCLQGTGCGYDTELIWSTTQDRR